VAAFLRAISSTAGFHMTCPTRRRISSGVASDSVRFIASAPFAVIAPIVTDGMGSRLNRC
jgi:hypothetical protein